MKKWIFAGVAVLLAFTMTMLACDDGIAPNVGSGDVDVDDIKSYSLTLNITGDKEVPTIISPNKSGRALTNALAQINHDYYEVVFYFDNETTATPAHTAPNIARTSWARGAGAALAVYRGNPTHGIDYSAVDFETSKSNTGIADIGAAILFVGKKESGRNVLLAVGRLNGTWNNDGSAGDPAVVTTQTSKVKFDIVTLASAIYPDKANLATKSSFYTIPDGTNGSYNFTGADSAGPPAVGAGMINAASTADNPGGGTNFLAQPYNNVNFPLFMLASDQGKACPGIAGACTETCCGGSMAADCSSCSGSCNTSDTDPCPLACCGATVIGSCASCTFASSVIPVTRYYAAKFTFTTATNNLISVAPPATQTPGFPATHLITNYVKGIVAAVPTSTTYKYTEMAPPGFITNGEKSTTYTDIETLTVEMKNNNQSGDKGKAIKEEAYFIITVPPNLGGMIAFNFNIPVHAITDAISNNSVTAMTWVIQPGLERYYVDNGVGLGGSILLGIGDPSRIEILPDFVVTP